MNGRSKELIRGGDGLNDAKALRALQRGSEDALAWIIDRYSAYVYTVAFHIVGQSMSPADAEEVAADVFAALWKHAETIKPSSLKSWLGTVARNTAKNKLRSAGQTLPLEDDLLILERDSAEDEILRREQSKLVRQAVLAMPYPDREIFLRHYYYCQKLETIAQEMDMNLSTVKTRLRRGREKLRSVLEQDVLDKGGT